MAYCTKCGTQVAEGVKFCTSCGTPMGAAQQPQPQPQPQQTYTQQPPYGQPYPQPAYTEEPISTGSYMLMFLLLMIPIVNLLCLIVWACGGSNKKNKVNLSRAMLFGMLIGAVIGGIIALAGGMLFVHIADDKHALDYFKQAEKIDPENPSVLPTLRTAIW